ncbi:MAG: hypothetical protein K9H49_03880 [Bacteroidales bacterium]|nr:hypothetical protein [Bacteroidales bacterium]MCF8391683.1 hypothetical protein [Bacteroidales bacterium]
MNHLSATFFFALFVLSACQNNVESERKSSDEKIPVKEISENIKRVRDYLEKDIVIAHRGSTFWTPEETEPAFRWARNIGADYLEFDLQLTKDSALVAIHDNNLTRTSNIKEIFPERAELEINNFTLKELRSLDVGSWFNSAMPEQAKESYIGLKILCLEDVVMIAQGYRLKKIKGEPELEMVNGEWTGNYVYELDPNDNGNRPGIYIETKNPKPNVEKILAEKITKLGWNINTLPKEIETQKGKVNIANTNARLILQSFSRKSIQQLDQLFPNIPKCLCLWSAKMKDDLEGNYIEAINFAVDNNVQIIGPSIAGEPNNYDELTEDWMTDLIHNAGMHVHPYTFDTEKQLNEYTKRVEGVFTNRADLALEFYKRKSLKTPQEILNELGYF